MFRESTLTNKQKLNKFKTDSTFGKHDQSQLKKDVQRSSR